jgi:acetyl-CoA acyltransferase
MATAGVAPRVMGIGPAPATQQGAGSQPGLAGQMDVIELNEAFAAQGLAVLRELGLSDDDPASTQRRRHRPGPSAGHERRAPGHHRPAPAAQRSGRYALCTMCIGVGQGIALILERL